MDNVVKEISPEIFDIVVNEADRLGLSVDDFLLRLIPTADGELALAPATDAEFEADMTLLGDEPSQNDPYDGTYSREDIYFDHD